MGVRMRSRYVVGSVPSSTKCGATCAAKPIRAGYGTPLITTRVRCWPMYSDDGRTPSFWSSKRCESPLASRAISPTGGVPTNGMWRQRSTQLGRKTRRRLRASTLTCARGSSGWYGGRSAFPRRNACMTWSYGSSIFKAVPRNWSPALYRVLTKSPTAPGSAVGAGSTPSRVERSVGGS